MLDYLTLLNKRKITLTDKDGDSQSCLDLLTKVAIPNNVPYYDFVVVNEHYVARPDLISLAIYGDDKYADVICKYNGISNPFELNENMVIFLPSIDRIEEMFVGKQPASELIEDESNTELIEKQYPFQKNKNEKRSPANSVVGENNFVIDKSLGVVFY